MPEYTLERTGQNPVVFEGTKICEAKSPAFLRHETKTNASKRCLWFEAAIYKTEKSGSYVLNIIYRFSGKAFRESNFDHVSVHKTPDDVVKALEEFEAQKCVTGFPPGPHWEDKQVLLMEAVQEDYDFLCEQLEGAFSTSLKGPERIE